MKRINLLLNSPLNVKCLIVLGKGKKRKIKRSYLFGWFDKGII